MRPFLACLVGAALVAALPASALDTSVDASLESRFVEFVDETTLQVPITVTCTAGATVMEAFVYVVQRGDTSQFAFFGPVCDGTEHSYLLTVHSEEEFTFRRGPARVSAYVLLESGASTSPTREVIIR